MNFKKCVILFLGAMAIGTPGGNVVNAADPSFKKVMIVILENADYNDALKQPGFSQFAKEGALLTNFNGITHPSQGNYIALAAGNTHGVNSDIIVTIDVKHIGDLLEAKGKTWKAYLEDFPSPCFTGKKSGDYVRKHNPFISFKNVQTNIPRCTSHLVAATALAEDIRAGQVPDYSIFVPNLKNDGHDTGAGYADRWFSKYFEPLMKDPNFMKDMLLVLTYDESEDYFGNHIFTAFYGDSVVPGSQATARYDHYSLLRTIENQLGLGTLGQKDQSATAITGIWK